MGRGSKCCDGVSNVEAEPRERLFSHALTKEAPLMRPLILGDLSKRTQTRSGSGVVFNFVVGCSNISLLEGWLLTRYCESHFCQLRFTQEQSAKVSYAKQHPQSMFQYFSNSIINNKQASKMWSLYSFEGLQRLQKLLILTKAPLTSAQRGAKSVKRILFGHFYYTTQVKLTLFTFLTRGP